MQKTYEKTQAMIEHLAAANRILEKHQYREARLIPILQEVQEEYKFLSRELISYIASALNLPPARVYGVATFYTHFSMQPKGKYILKLCDGTACHVKKSHSILNALYAKLNLSGDKRTTDDLLFTIDIVSCLGACGLAPVMLANDEVHGQITPERAVEIVDELIAAEKRA